MAAAHVAHVFHSFGVGGSEVRTCQIINGLGGSFRHTIVSLDGNFDAARLLENLEQVSLVHPPGLASGPFFPNALASRRQLARLDPDLLIAYSWGGFEWLVGNSVRKVCPDVFSIEGFISDEADRELPRRRLIRRLFARRATRVHACSVRLQRMAVGSWGVDPASAAYIPNGIDLTRFRHVDRRGRTGPLTFGIVASLSPVKNHRLLLDAFSRMAPGARELRIAGEGPERERLQARAAGLGLANVRLLGHLADPVAMLEDLDVFCLSSQSEQMPIAVLEAMAAGLPVVSTDVGDVRRMVCEANAPFVVPPEDPGAYAAALSALAGDAGLRLSIGEENRKRCHAEFGFPLMLERHRALYTECMATPTTRIDHGRKDARRVVGSADSAADDGPSRTRGWPR